MPAPAAVCVAFVVGTVATFAAAVAFKEVKNIAFIKLLDY